MRQLAWPRSYWYTSNNNSVLDDDYDDNLIEMIETKKKTTQ